MYYILYIHHCYIELIVQRVKPLQISAWDCTAEQFETNSLFRLALCILVFKVRLSCTNSTEMIRYLEAVFYLRKKIKPKFGSVWAVFFGREGALNLILDIRNPWLLSDTASPDFTAMWLILNFFSYLYTAVGFFWQVLRALPTDVQPLPELYMSLLMNTGQRIHRDVERDSYFVWRWFKSCAVWSTLSD